MIDYKHMCFLIKKMKEVCVKDLRDGNSEVVVQDLLNLCEVYDEFIKKLLARDLESQTWASDLKKAFSDFEQHTDVYSSADFDDKDLEPADFIANPITHEKYKFNPDEESDYDIPEADELFEKMDESDSESENEVLVTSDPDVEEIEIDSNFSLFQDKPLAGDNFEDTPFEKRSLFRKGMTTNERMALYVADGSLFDKTDQMNPGDYSEIERPVPSDDVHAVENVLNEGEEEVIPAMDDMLEEPVLKYEPETINETSSVGDNREDNSDDDLKSSDLFNFIPTADASDDDYSYIEEEEDDEDDDWQTPDFDYDDFDDEIVQLSEEDLLEIAEFYGNNSVEDL